MTDGSFKAIVYSKRGRASCPPSPGHTGPDPRVSDALCREAKKAKRMGRARCTSLFLYGALIGVSLRTYVYRSYGSMEDPPHVQYTA